jgi:general L-amino acid transport system permease protein
MSTEERIPLWRDDRVLKVVGQVAVVLILGVVIAWLAGNLIQNYQAKNLSFGFGFLVDTRRPASFGIGDTPIPYSPQNTFGRALIVGFLNSLRVMIIGIVLATILGIIAGIARLADNWLVRQIATVYVELFRNTPLLLQLFFWYFAFFLKLPRAENRLQLPGPIFLSNQGLTMPWPAGSLQTWLSIAVLIVSVVVSVVLWRRRTRMIVQQGASGQTIQWILSGIAVLCLLVLVFGLDWQRPELATVGNTSQIRGGLNLSPEFGALLFGLTIYTAAFIAEVVRAGIQSVSKGQWEAAKALGLQPNLVMQLVIFPQALRVMIPPLTSEFLNLAKNSSLATAIGYSDVYSVANTTANQTGASVQMLLVVMTTYLTINLIISLGMNVFNQSVQLRER